jgi:hypothetical protein
MASRDLFRVTPAASGALMLFDAAGASPRVWFVPPATAAQGDLQ